MAAGSAAGFAGGRIISGSWSGALEGAFQGALIGYGGFKFGIFGAAVAGGISAEAFYDDHFITGMLSAGVGVAGNQVLGSALRLSKVLINAAVGGTISKITGGKFANGAVSATLSYITTSLAEAASSGRDLTQVSVRDMTNAEFESIFGTPDEWVAHDSLATMQQDQMHRMFLKGTITEGELKDFQGAQLEAALMGAGGIGVGFGFRALRHMLFKKGVVNLTKSQQKAVRGLQNQIKDHQKKLADYRRNPDAFDNKGFLKNVTPELRDKIIQSRIRSLEGQINTFRKRVDSIRDGSVKVLEKGG